MSLFSNALPLKDKKITAEACVHHMWFSRNDYKELGTKIKCNPAIKSQSDRDMIRKAVKEGIIDVIATDHAPHTMEEKDNNYWNAPSGLPLVQHSVQMMFEMVKQGLYTEEEVVEKMAHNLAILFRIKDRGYLREGYWADIVIVDPNTPYTISKDNLLYKCGWSPLEGETFSHSISHTIISGNLAFENGKLIEYGTGQRMKFNAE